MPLPNMNDDDDLLHAKINYYCREKYFQSMQNAAQEGLKKYSGDPVYKFYYGLSLAFEGRVQESIRELDSLQNDSEVMLGAILTLIYAHRKFKSIDKEAVNRLDAKLKESRKKANDKALYFAGLFLFHTGRYDKAKEYIDRMLKLNPSYRQGNVIKGWVEIMSSKEMRDHKGKTAVQFFDIALSSSQKDIDALFGKAKFFEFRNNFSASLEHINQIVASFPSFLPALIEKMKLLLALQDWEQTLDMANRALTIDPHCLEALRFHILHLLCREGNYNDAVTALSELWKEMNTYEPKNANLFWQTAQLFGRLCGRHNGILQHTFNMAEKATELDDRNADYVTELGYQCILQKKMREGIKYYKNATKLDGTSVNALTGIIFCQLLEGQYDNAEQQLEFLREVQMAIGPSAELLYLHAVLSRIKLKSSDEIIRLLDESFHAHCSSFKTLPLGVQYLMLLNCDFLMLLVKEYLAFVPSQPLSSGQSVPSVLKQCLLILELVTKACPGMLEGLFLMAKVKYLTGDIKAATGTLQHIIDNVNSTFSDAYLLMAQIQLHQNALKQASHYLEVGLSYNFEVRDHPTYHLVKAQIHKKLEEFDEALSTLQTAMNLAGVKTAGGSVVKKNGSEITITDKVSLYLELADIYRMLNKQSEAAKTMQDATKEFQGSSEEDRIIIASADLALARGDIDNALSVLKSIGPAKPYYMQAREKMADIYLHHRKDKRMFASCYREIVEKFPKNTQAYLLLGDAYMSIQEPELAIDVYERALKENPKDSILASKIGQALVKTHNYGKAINYYKEALKNEDQGFLRYDLASLFLRLRQYDKAEKVLLEAIEKESGNKGNDSSSLMAETKALTLLAEVYQKSGNLQNSVKTLMRSKDVQNRVIKRVAVEQPDALAEQKHLASVICCHLAEHAAVQRNYQKSIEFYKEAVTYEETNSQAMLDLAHMYMIIGDLDACQHTCTTLLRNDKDNDSATVMMANLNFFKNDYDAAMFHFQQLLDRKPENLIVSDIDSYDALARLIEVMRRMGRLEDVPIYLERAEQISPRSSMEPGFNYCKALFEWYTGNANNALKIFNKSRKDNDWGQRAIRNMIEICLNPDNDILGGETFESMDSDANVYDRQDSQELAIKTADKLLKELKNAPGDIRPVILANNLLLVTRQKPLAEKALNEFMQIASNDLYRDHVGVILGIATANMILKQVPRARNQLKRVAKSTWNFEDAEDLEKCWLLLADNFIQSGKYDMSTELLRRVLQHNRSCSKAYEYMGYIMEKEQSYKDAAAHYELAWKFSNKNNPGIGYKLAFNYMKAKRYVDAIDVCHMVLAKYPNYPKIRKDILEKSRANLRV